MPQFEKIYFISKKTDVKEYHNKLQYHIYLNDIFSIPSDSLDFKHYQRNFYFEKLDKDFGLYQYSIDNEVKNGKSIYVDYCLDYLIENGHKQLDKFETYKKEFVFFIVLRDGRLVSNVVDDFKEFDKSAISLLKEKEIIKESEYELVKMFAQLKNKKSVLSIHDLDDESLDRFERDLHNFSIREDINEPILFQVSHYHKGLLNLNVTVMRDKTVYIDS